jgi:hypothetical protein
MVLLIAVGICVFFIFIKNPIEQLTMTNLVAKMFTTTTLAAGAVYAARQATKQEEIEKYSRKTEMELMAFDPFAASLPEDTRAALKEEFIKKTFGRDDVMGMKSTQKDEEVSCINPMNPIFTKAVEEVIKNTQ